jgi:septum formation protein
MLPLYLASASPRRRELLDSLGLRFSIEPAEIDENVLPGESAEDHVVRLAAGKAAAVAGALRHRGVAALVLAADTTVAIDAAILGKPADEGEALAMLGRLAGTRHEVLTACRLVRTDDGRVAATVAVTVVRFNPWDERLARWYVGTGEPMDKAGAYAIQGRAGAFVERLEGSYTGVMGLPLFETARLLRAFGIAVP